MTPEALTPQERLEFALKELKVVAEQLETAKELRATSEVQLENSKARLKAEQDRGVALLENRKVLLENWERHLRIVQLWAGFVSKTILYLLVGAFGWVLVMAFKHWVWSL